MLSVIKFNPDYVNNGITSNSDGIAGTGDWETNSIHNLSMYHSGNMELIETETGALITFGDGDTFYLAEIDKSGQVVNAPRPILYDVDSHTVVTATQIDDNIALAYSKGNQALDESEVFSVVNASDLKRCDTPNKKLQTVK